MMQLAFRNLWRRKRRTLITAISIAFGFWLAVILIGIRESSSQRFIKAGAKAGYGYLTLAPADFKPNQAQFSRMQTDAKLWQTIASLPEILYALPRRLGESILQSTSQNTGAAWMAVDPKRESPDVNLYCEYMREGSCGPTWTEGAIVGSILAEKLKLKRDDELIYTVQLSESQSISMMTHVHGIFHTSSEDLDSHLFIMPQTEIEKELPPSARYISYVALFVDNTYQVDQVAKKLNQLLEPNVRAFTWKQTQPSLVEYFAADKLMFFILMTFICLIIASGIATCMNMNFIERRKEIGTLLAIGMYPRQILSLLLREAACLGCVGSLVGILVTAPFYLYLNIYGVDVSPFMGHTMSVGGVTQSDMIIHCRLLPWQALLILVTPMLSSLIAALVPAYIASHTLPVEILREA